jgi:hypothetical protein
MQYMKAVLLARTKEFRDDGSIIEIVVWELTEPLPPSRAYIGTNIACSTGPEALVGFVTTTNAAKAITDTLTNGRVNTPLSQSNGCLKILNAMSQTGARS